MRANTNALFCCRITHVRTHIHTCTYKHRYTLKPQTHTYTHTYLYIHTQIPTCLHTHTHIHTYKHTHTNTHTHIHICTHMHIQNKCISYINSHAQTLRHKGPLLHKICVWTQISKIKRKLIFNQSKSRIKDLRLIFLICDQTCKFYATGPKSQLHEGLQSEKKVIWYNSMTSLTTYRLFIIPFKGWVARHSCY